jgi:hypothetical protein
MELVLLANHTDYAADPAAFQEAHEPERQFPLFQR